MSDNAGKKFGDALRAKLDPFVALVQYGIAIVLLLLVLLTVLRLSGLAALPMLPKVDPAGLAYACGSFWAVTRAWS